MAPNPNIETQMRKGWLEYFILLLLSHGKAYSSDILANLKEAKLIVVEGTLYTLLNRLRREGKLDYEWKESTQGPPRKYYFITAYGMRERDNMTRIWDDMCATVNLLRNPKNPR